MIGRLALRSLTAHPVRSAVLAAGFGVGVGVMAILLGVAEIVLRQAQSPALVGGGDVLVQLSAAGAGTARARPARCSPTPCVRASASRHRLRPPICISSHDDGTTRVAARGGIPESRARARRSGDIGRLPHGPIRRADRGLDTADARLGSGAIDRFHPIPDAPDWADSWAEWLYFNGRAADARFYLTFLVGPRTGAGCTRIAGVRLQLERNGAMETFTASAVLSDADVASAPNLTIGASSVRLDGLRLPHSSRPADARGRPVRGDLTLAGIAGPTGAAAGDERAPAAGSPATSCR